jgi:cyclic pyranopterin phosphate synthase
MTTNGIALHRRLPIFVDSGLTHLNLSLDTLDPFKFELITRRRGHGAVLKSLDTALHLSMKSIKLNVVVIRGLNDSEVLDFVKLTKDKPISVRFIEFMPFTGPFYT